MSNVRRHKGLEPAEAVSGAGSVAIDGAFEEWQQVLPVFRDPPGDTAHRNFRNTDGSAQLTNSTGRNDIIEARIAHDASSLYFYARTAHALSPPNDPNWMLLFVDSDQNSATGWQGYDFLIGKVSSSAVALEPRASAAPPLDRCTATRARKLWGRSRLPIIHRGLLKPAQVHAA